MTTGVSIDPKCVQCGAAIVATAEWLAAHGHAVGPEPQDEGHTTRDLVRLTQRKRELSAEAKRVGDQIDKIEAALLDEWQEAGKSSETVDGHTVYINGRQWATPRDGDRLRVVRTLESLGMDDMVTYNTATLSSYVKELLDAGEEVPPDLSEVIDLTTNWSLNVRRKA